MVLIFPVCLMVLMVNNIVNSSCSCCLAVYFPALSAPRIAAHEHWIVFRLLISERYSMEASSVMLAAYILNITVMFNTSK